MALTFTIEGGTPPPPHKPLAGGAFNAGFILHQAYKKLSLFMTN